MNEEQPALNPIESSGRYLLAEAEAFYGIWDRERPGDPIAQFPADEAGLDDAMHEFNRLVRVDRIVRIGPVSLKWALFVGLGLWILGDVLMWIWTLTSAGDPFLAGPFPGDPSAALWIKLAQIMQDIGFRIWVGALAIAAALWFLGRGRERI